MPRKTYDPKKGRPRRVTHEPRWHLRLAYELNTTPANPGHHPKENR